MLYEDCETSIDERFELTSFNEFRFEFDTTTELRFESVWATLAYKIGFLASDMLRLPVDVAYLVESVEVFVENLSGMYRPRNEINYLELIKIIKKRLT